VDTEKEFIHNFMQGIRTAFMQLIQILFLVPHCNYGHKYSYDGLRIDFSTTKKLQIRYHVDQNTTKQNHCNNSR
jgi:hypothetical protein